MCTPWPVGTSHGEKQKLTDLTTIKNSHKFTLLIYNFAISIVRGDVLIIRH